MSALTISQMKDRILDWQGSCYGDGLTFGEVLDSLIAQVRAEALEVCDEIRNRVDAPLLRPGAQRCYEAIRGLSAAKECHTCDGAKRVKVKSSDDRFHAVRWAPCPDCLRSQAQEAERG